MAEIETEGTTSLLGELSETDKTLVQKNNGQVIQIARGNLVTRLQKKALAHGELFVHCVESKSGTDAQVEDGVLVKDLVTGTGMPLISTGDIFMGANSRTQVYRIGGGGSLKWGGVLFLESSETAIGGKLTSTPDTIYLWNGPVGLTLYKEGQPGKVDRKISSGLLKDSKETFTLNPGDLVFYSSAIQQLVYLPMNRSTWGTTFTDGEDLGSEWLKGEIQALEGETLEVTIDDLTKVKETLEGKEVSFTESKVDGNIILQPKSKLSIEIDGESKEIEYFQETVGTDNIASYQVKYKGSEGLENLSLDAQIEIQDDTPYSLTDFTNNVANHYQYLFENKGWKDITETLPLKLEFSGKDGSSITVTEDTSLSTPYSLITGEENSKVATVQDLKDFLSKLEEFLKEKKPETSENEEFYENFRGLEVSAKLVVPEDFNYQNDPEGAIYYTPRLPLVSKLEFEEAWLVDSDKGEDDTQVGKTLNPGDLVVTVTKEKEAGYRVHRIIPLGSQIIESISGDEEPPTIERVDAYADLLWKDEDEEFKNTNKNNLKAYIEYLFKTKVDIDPETNKIISSQLPDFLLGALKYMGPFTTFLSGENFELPPNWEKKSLEDKLTFIQDRRLDKSSKFYPVDEDVSKDFEGKFDWDNIDGNEDTILDYINKTESNAQAYKDLNKNLQTGCYWIYNKDDDFKLTKDEADQYKITWRPEGSQKAKGLKLSELEVVDISSFEEFPQAFRFFASKVDRQEETVKGFWSSAPDGYSLDYCTDWGRTESGKLFSSYQVSYQGPILFEDFEGNFSFEQPSLIKGVYSYSEDSNLYSYNEGDLLYLDGELVKLEEPLAILNDCLVNLDTLKGYTGSSWEPLFKEVIKEDEDGNGLEEITSKEDLLNEALYWENWTSYPGVTIYHIKGRLTNYYGLSSEDFSHRVESYSTYKDKVQMTYLENEGDYDGIFNIVREGESVPEGAELVVNKLITETYSKPSSEESFLELATTTDETELNLLFDTWEGRDSHDYHNLIEGPISWETFRDCYFNEVDFNYDVYQEFWDNKGVLSLVPIIKAGKDLNGNKIQSKEVDEETGEIKVIGSQIPYYTRKEGSGVPLDGWEYLVSDPISDGLGSEGPQMTIHKGDWIVWNGETFDVIHQGTSFVGLQIETLPKIYKGVPRLVHSERKVRDWSWSGSFNGESKTVEAAFQDDGEGHIQVTAPNAVLFKKGSEPLTDVKYLPVISKEGLAQSSEFKIGANSNFIQNGKFKLDYLEHSEVISKDLDLIDKDGEVWKDYPELKEGGSFDFLDIENIDWFEPKDTSKYSWKDKEETLVKLFFPKGSGTIATQEWTSLGFATTELLIRDSIKALEDKVTGGHKDWLQTIREAEDGKKEFVDSRVQQVKEDGELTLRLYTEENPEQPDENEGTHKDLVVKDTIKDSNTGYKLELENGKEKVLNPATAEADKEVQNILPNHSGVLLNNNSVIDGGYWG